MSDYNEGGALTRPMVKVIYRTLQTSTGATQFSPPAGEYWEILNGGLSLSTGATAGTRSVYITVQGNDPTKTMNNLMTIANQTGINSSYISVFTQVNGAYVPGGTAYQNTSHVICDETQVIQVNSLIVSGDNYEFEIHILALPTGGPMVKL